MIRVVHCCVPRVQSSEGTISSFACWPPSHTPAEKGCWYPPGLATLGKALDRAGLGGTVNRKTLVGQSSRFSGVTAITIICCLLYPSHCTKGERIRGGLTVSRWGAWGERLRPREIQAPSVNWQNHPSVPCPSIHPSIQIFMNADCVPGPVPSTSPSELYVDHLL